MLSSDTLRRLETLGTLARIYAGAQAIGADNEVVLAKSRDYKQRFAAAYNAAVIQFDLDGDGVADFEKHLGATGWLRI